MRDNPRDAWWQRYLLTLISLDFLAAQSFHLFPWRQISAGCLVHRDYKWFGLLVLRFVAGVFHLFDWPIMQSNILLVLEVWSVHSGGWLEVCLWNFFLFYKLFHFWTITIHHRSGDQATRDYVLQPNTILSSKIQATNKKLPRGFDQDAMYDTNNMLGWIFAVKVLVIYSCARRI